MYSKYAQWGGSVLVIPLLVEPDSISAAPISDLTTATATNTTAETDL